MTMYGVYSPERCVHGAGDLINAAACHYLSPGFVPAPGGQVLKTQDTKIQIVCIPSLTLVAKIQN